MCPSRPGPLRLSVRVQYDVAKNVDVTRRRRENIPFYRWLWWRHLKYCQRLCDVSVLQTVTYSLLRGYN